MEETNLFVLERYNKIADYLKDRGRVTVTELSELLFVSPATIRRDLAAMQRLGMLKRTHGGAIHVENGDDVSIFVRMESESEEKEMAAMVALNHLPEFTSVFIDNSSTCFALAERMDFSYKTVVTNGLQVASRLANRKNIELILLGGTVRYNTNATHGGFSFSMLNSLRFDLMLSGAASIDTDGAYERSLDTTDIKKAVFLRSKQKVLVVGKSKFELKYPYRVAELADYDAICTDSKTPTVEKLKEKGIKIFYK